MLVRILEGARETMRRRTDRQKNRLREKQTDTKKDRWAGRKTDICSQPDSHSTFRPAAGDGGN